MKPPAPAPIALALFAALGDVACQDVVLVVDPPWDASDVVILVEHDDRGQPFRVSVHEPGAPIVLEVSNEWSNRLTALVYSADLPEGLNPLACGVELGSTHPIGLKPRIVYAAPATLLQSRTEFSFAPQDASSLPDIPLSYLRCFSDPYECSRLSFKTHPFLGADGDITALAIQDDDTVYYGASVARDKEINNFLLASSHSQGASDPEQRLLSAGTSTLTYRIGGLALDQGTLIGVMANGGRFRTSLDGAILDSQPGDPGFNQLAGRGDLVVEYGPGGLRAVVGSLPPLLTEVESVVVVNDRRVAAFGAGGISYFDGGQWRQEASFSDGTRWSIGGDEEVLVAVQTDGEVLRRIEAEGAWESLGRPFGNNLNLKHVTGLGRGRFIVTGQDGLLGVHTTVADCQAEILFPNNYDLVQRSPSGRTVYLTTADNGSVTGDFGYLVRLDLPSE